MEVEGMWEKIVNVFGKKVEKKLGKRKIVQIIKKVVFEKKSKKDWGMGVV